MRVMGVDPGLRLTGYGCVDGQGSAIQKPDLVEAGVIRLVKGSAPAGSVGDRLVELEAEFDALLAAHRPDVVSIETIFTNPKHPGTVIVQGHARGVLMLAARKRSLPVVEVKPSEVKKGLTGHGAASKSQMQAAIAELFGLPEPPKPADVADALAIALCGLVRAGLEEAVAGE